jgi:hypothetical protein
MAPKHLQHRLHERLGLDVIVKSAPRLVRRDVIVIVSRVVAFRQRVFLAQRWLEGKLVDGRERRDKLLVEVVGKYTLGDAHRKGLVHEFRIL